DVALRGEIQAQIILLEVRRHDARKGADALDHALGLDPRIVRASQTDPGDEAFTAPRAIQRDAGPVDPARAQDVEHCQDGLPQRSFARRLLVQETREPAHAALLPRQRAVVYVPLARRVKTTGSSSFLVRQVVGLIGEVLTVLVKEPAVFRHLFLVDPDAQAGAGRSAPARRGAGRQRLDDVVAEVRVALLVALDDV